MLVNCKDCGKRISSESRVCNNCGRPTEKGEILERYSLGRRVDDTFMFIGRLVWFVLYFILFFFVYFFIDIVLLDEKYNSREVFEFFLVTMTLGSGYFWLNKEKFPTLSIFFNFNIILIILTVIYHFIK